MHDNPPVIEGIPGTQFQDEVVIRRLRWASDETGFAIIDADRAGDEVVLVGTIAHLEERERVRISGQWQDDKRYGLQVKVATAEPLAPTGEAALLVYLKRVRHVGGRRAERLLELYGEAVLETIDHDPRAAFRRLGLSAGRITEAVKSWDELRSSRALHLLLAPHGLAWLVPRIERHYGPRAHRVVRERPYDLTSVFGIGFQTADTIARSVNVPADAPARAHAGVLHVLSEAERAGSTCLPVAELAVRAGELLGTAPDAKQLGEMADAGTLVIELSEANAGMPDNEFSDARHRARRSSRRARTRRARLSASRARPTRSGPTAPRRRSSSATSPRSSESWPPRRRVSRLRARHPPTTSSPRPSRQPRSAPRSPPDSRSSPAARARARPRRSG